LAVDEEATLTGASVSGSQLRVGSAAIKLRGSISPDSSKLRGGPAHTLLEAPGFLALTATPQGLVAADLAAPLRPPAVNALTDEEQRQQFADLLFQPPPEQVVRARIDRLIAPFLAQPRHDLAAPETLAQVVAMGYALGKSQQEIARDLAPHVDGVRASSRRVARTWSMHVAAESQWEAHQELGDLVIGYQIHSTFSHYTRSWHAHRSGTIYYKDPGPGQKGYRQMPHPPSEAEDAAERPAGTPALAWN
jgi:hypothetical protein